MENGDPNRGVYVLISQEWDGSFDCELFSEKPTFDLKNEIAQTVGSYRIQELRVANINGGDSLLIEHAELQIIHYMGRK